MMQCSDIHIPRYPDCRKEQLNPHNSKILNTARPRSNGAKIPKNVFWCSEHNKHLFAKEMPSENKAILNCVSRSVKNPSTVSIQVHGRTTYINPQVNNPGLKSLRNFTGRKTQQNVTDIVIVTPAEVNSVCLLNNTPGIDPLTFCTVLFCIQVLTYWKQNPVHRE